MDTLWLSNLVEQMRSSCVWNIYCILFHIFIYTSMWSTVKFSRQWTQECYNPMNIFLISRFLNVLPFWSDFQKVKCLIKEEYINIEHCWAGTSWTSHAGVSLWSDEGNESGGQRKKTGFNQASICEALAATVIIWINMLPVPSHHCGHQTNSSNALQQAQNKVPQSF